MNDIADSDPSIVYYALAGVAFVFFFVVMSELGDIATAVKNIADTMKKDRR